MREVWGLVLVVTWVKAADPLLFPQEGPTEPALYCRKKAACQPVANRTCFGHALPYTHTSTVLVPELYDVSQVLSALASWQGLQYVPQCWRVLQPLLCSVYMPPCYASGDYVLLPSKEICNDVRHPCRIMESVPGAWPSFLSCNNRSIFPPECKSDKHKALVFSKTTVCLPPLVQTTDPKSWLPSIEGCGLPCQNPLFSDLEHQRVHNFVLFLAVVCLALSLFTFLTFILDWSSVRYPARILFFINSCFCVGCLGWLAQFLPGARRDIVCRSDGTLRQTEPQVGSGETAACVVVFVMVYYSLMAAVAWFLVLAYSWQLIYCTLGSSRDVLSAKKLRFHLFSWTFPLVLTIACLGFTQIDGDSLSGICFVGGHSHLYRAVFVLLPVAIVIIASIFFVLKALLSLVQLKLDNRGLINDGAALEIRNSILRISIFGVLALVFAVITFAVHIYIFSNEGSWHASFQDYIVCKANMTAIHGQHSPSCDIANRPSLAAFQFHIAAYFGAGIVMSSWVWNKTTLVTWKAFITRRKKSNTHKDDLIKDRLGAYKERQLQMADIRGKIHKSKRSISFRSSQSDALGMRLDCNSFSSHTSAWSMTRRRHSIGQMSRHRRRFSDSEIDSRSSILRRSLEAAERASAVCWRMNQIRQSAAGRHHSHSSIMSGLSMGSLRYSLGRPCTPDSWTSQDVMAHHVPLLRQSRGWLENYRLFGGNAWSEDDEEHRLGDDESNEVSPKGDDNMKNKKMRKGPRRWLQDYRLVSSGLSDDDDNERNGDQSLHSPKKIDNSDQKSDNFSLKIDSINNPKKTQPLWKRQGVRDSRSWLGNYRIARNAWSEDDEDWRRYREHLAGDLFATGDESSQPNSGQSQTGSKPLLNNHGPVAKSSPVGDSHQPHRDTDENARNLKGSTRKGRSWLRDYRPVGNLVQVVGSEWNMTRSNDLSGNKDGLNIDMVEGNAKQKCEHMDSIRDANKEISALTCESMQCNELQIKPIPKKMRSWLQSYRPSRNEAEIDLETSNNDAIRSNHSQLPQKDGTWLKDYRRHDNEISKNDCNKVVSNEKAIDACLKTKVSPMKPCSWLKGYRSANKTLSNEPGNSQISKVASGNSARLSGQNTDNWFEKYRLLSVAQPGSEETLNEQSDNTEDEGKDLQNIDQHSKADKALPKPIELAKEMPSKGEDVAKNLPNRPKLNLRPLKKKRPWLENVKHPRSIEPTPSILYTPSSNNFVTQSDSPPIHNFAPQPLHSPLINTFAPEALHSPQMHGFQPNPSLCDPVYAPLTLNVYSQPELYYNPPFALPLGPHPYSYMQQPPIMYPYLMHPSLHPNIYHYPHILSPKDIYSDYFTGPLNDWNANLEAPM